MTASTSLHRGRERTGLEPFYPTSLEKYIKWRLYDDRNCLVVVDGDTGSGKSSLAISLIAHLLDPEFIPERQCFFNAGSILYVVKEILNEPEKASRWYGKWIMFDEAGQGADKKLSMSGGVQEFGHMLDTFRKYNINLMITCPEKGSLGRDIVFTHSHILIWVSGNCKEAKSIFGRWRVRARFEDEIQFVNPSCVMYNERGESNLVCNKCYMGRIGRCSPKSHNPMWKKGKAITVDFCPQEVWTPYEKLKDTYVAKMMDSARERLNRLEGTSNLLINRNLAEAWTDEPKADPIEEELPFGISARIPTRKKFLDNKEGFIG